MRRMVVTVVIVALLVAVAFPGLFPRSVAQAASSITLTRTPAPPSCVLPGGVESFTWGIQFTSTPDHYTYFIQNPNSTVVYGPFTVNIQGQPSPVTGADQWPVPSNALPGTYLIQLDYVSGGGLEATTQVQFIVCTPSTPTNTPTSTPTNTPTNTPTSTPTNTPTSTPTNTPTSTPTNTPTPTKTAIPTRTSTPQPGCVPSHQQPKKCPTRTPTR
jgi:hypothetical protein